jgi:hypothetical protein
MKINPFKPGSIAGPGAFAGRAAELTSIDRCLYQTKNGNPSHFLIHGERGIGKSSLLFATELTARGEVTTMEDNLTLNFIPLSLSLEASDTYSDTINRVGRLLSGALDERQQFRAMLKSAWKFFTRWTVMGVKYDTEDSTTHTESQLVENLADSFAKADTALTTNIDGFLILIDEADRAKNSDLGRFLKLFTEQLTRRNCSRVAIGIAGITDVIDLLKSSHESAIRILLQMRLDPLLPDERLQVIRQGIEGANKKNAQKTTIHADAAQLISKLSEGYPHFIQQYAYSAFDADMDDHIMTDDVIAGAYSENGALDQLGARYFEGMYSDEIDSDDYRKVLKVMAADASGEYISRKQIKLASGLKDTTLSNALAAMSKRHIVTKHREKSGLYKLPTGSFKAWILARARKEEQQKAAPPVPPDASENKQQS